MLNVFTFLVKGRRTEGNIPMESVGINENDALLHLEQYLKKTGFVFEEILSSTQTLEK